MFLRSGRIEICGGIGSGKSTLAMLLAKQLKATSVLENYRENPFWHKYYRNPDLYVREKDISFLIHHIGEIKWNSESTLLICDYAVFQDLAYASFVDNERHIESMTILYDDLYSQLQPPSLIINLQSTSSLQLARIKKRGREEEQSIDANLLDLLNNRTEEYLLKFHKNSPRLNIESVEGRFLVSEKSHPLFDLLSKVQISANSISV